MLGTRGGDASLRTEAVRRFAMDELMFADGARLLSEDLPGSYRNRST
jgi:hypothetical protein